MNQEFQHLHMPVELAIEFIAVFSRMEHALKSTKYAIGNESRVDPAWDRFSNDINAEFQNIKEEQLTQAVSFLLTEPPKKQVIVGTRVGFVDQVIDPNQKTTQQLIRMVRTVRNNLFHGGKYLPNGEVEEGRNQRLVEASLLVLKACVRLNEEVKSSYER